MTEEQEELTIDLPHVAALTMATWIYLIAQNEEARDIIGNLADKLYNEMNAVEDDNEQTGTSSSEDSSEESQG